MDNFNYYHIYGLVKFLATTNNTMLHYMSMHPANIGDNFPALVITVHLLKGYVSCQYLWTVR